MRTIWLTMCMLLLLAFSCDNNGEEIKPDYGPIQDILRYSNELKVGAASANVNPDYRENVSLEGYGYRNSTGINDTLEARVMVIQKDSAYIIMISLDLVGIRKEQCNALKARIFDYTGIPESKIFVHATHTHSAPSMLDGRADQNYLNKLNVNVTNGVLNAIQRLEPVTAEYKSGHSTVNTVNRRNPDRIPNNAFHVVDFKDAAGNVVASILNFSCHPVVLGPNNLMITADFVHYLRNAYESEMGGMALFFNGYFGNINPARTSVGNPYDRNEGTFTYAEIFGTALANDMINNASSSETLDIHITHKTSVGTLGTQYTHISLVDFGELQIAMIPGEPFELLGEQVEAMMPGPYKMTFGNMYEHIGYIVPAQEWQGCTNSFIQQCYEETVSQGEQVAPLILQKFEELCDD